MKPGCLKRPSLFDFDNDGTNDESNHKQFQFDEEQYEVWYNSLLAEADKIPSHYQNHTSISTILRDEDVQTLILYIFGAMIFPSNSSVRKTYELDDIIFAFKGVGVDLHEFCPTDLEAKYKTYALGRFLKMCFVYTI